MLHCLLLIAAISGQCELAREDRTETINDNSKSMSPNDVWESYREAIRNRHWEDAFRCLTPRAQERHISQIIFATAYVRKTKKGKAGAERLVAILDKHGLNLDKVEALSDANPTDEHILDDAIRGVTDKGRLFDEALAVIVTEFGDSVNVPSGEDGKFGPLTEVKITGDKATGKCMQRLAKNDTYDVGGVRQTEIERTIRFCRNDERWCIDSLVMP